MVAIFQYFVCVITTHIVGTIGAAFAFVGAALLAYAREQVRAGLKWALAPLMRRLPWNRKDTLTSASSRQQGFVSEFSLIDVFLLDPYGKGARYQKTSSYIAVDDLESYQEGVTAEGYAAAFSTMRGTIVQTVKEHGFYISRINFVEVLQKGARFTNVYGAELHDCFTKTEEHWTQELAFPTKHLTIRIHFPDERPPKAIRCKTVEGTQDKPAKTVAKLVELFGRQSIVWEIEKPKQKDIFKLEWTW